MTLTLTIPSFKQSPQFWINAIAATIGMVLWGLALHWTDALTKPATDHSRWIDVMGATGFCMAFCQGGSAVLWLLETQRKGGS